jgi:hypothetical protein
MKTITSGDFVYAKYRGNSGIVYYVNYVLHNGIATIWPALSPTGEIVTRAHGYKKRSLHVKFLEIYNGNINFELKDIYWWSFECKPERNMKRPFYLF